MRMLPPAASPLWAAAVLAALVVALAILNVKASDISQIVSQITAAVALYVVKQSPAGISTPR